MICENVLGSSSREASLCRARRNTRKHTADAINSLFGDMTDVKAKRRSPRCVGTEGFVHYLRRAGTRPSTAQATRRRTGASPRQIKVCATLRAVDDLIRSFRARVGSRQRNVHLRRYFFERAAERRLEVEVLRDVEVVDFRDAERVRSIRSATSPLGSLGSPASLRNFAAISAISSGA